MKRFIVAFVCLLALVSGSTASAWDAPKKDIDSAPKDDKSVREVLWEGNTDIDMLKQVRSDLQYARDNKEIKTLRVTLISPGGPVVICIEMARLIRQASDNGLKVEMHGRGIVASCGTFVLAAGTPGLRSITKETLVLVHPPQLMGSCVEYKHEPKTENEKITNAILNLGRDLYARLTGQPIATAEKWLTCGNEQAGDGQLAVDLKLADQLDK